MIIDLTPIHNKTGPARLLDMIEGRSKQAFKTWLADRPTTWRDAVEVVAMDGFTGFKTAATEKIPDAVDGHGPVPRGPTGRQRPRRVPAPGPAGHLRAPGTQTKPTRSTRSRRTLQTGADLLTDKQKTRLQTLFAADEHAEVEATWGDLSTHHRRPTANPTARPAAP